MSVEMKEWEVRGWTPHGEYGALASGLASTFPDAGQRQSMREGGLEIYVDGKPFKEPKAASEAKGKRKKK